MDTLRESKLRPILEKMLPILCVSLWGNVPEGLTINFPTLWTPTAGEIADIALKKAQAIRDMFQAGLFRADTAQRELKALAEETGMFGSITDEEIAANAGKTYQDVVTLKDPLAGLSFEEEADLKSPEAEYPQEEEGLPFDLTTDSMTLDYNENHDPANGRFTSGGGSGKIGKTKYAPSPRRNPGGISVSAKKDTQLCGTMNTRYPGLEEGQIRRIRDTKREYTVKADGYGGMEILKVDKLR